MRLDVGEALEHGRPVDDLDGEEHEALDGGGHVVAALQHDALHHAVAVLPTEPAICYDDPGALVRGFDLLSLVYVIYSVFDLPSLPAGHHKAFLELDRSPGKHHIYEELWMHFVYID